MKPLHNITRFEFGNTNAWWVRFQVGNKKNIVSKLFSDAKCGGKRKALQQAKAWRDAQSPKVYKKRKARPYVGPGPGTLCKKTIYYYCRSDDCYYSYQAWCAWILVGKKMCQTKWSIDKHGSKKAKEKTEKWLNAKRLAQRKQQKGMKHASSR